MSKIKIGILTYYRVRNYGAILQAFGLFKWLKINTDADVEIIDYTHPIFLKKLSNVLFVTERGLIGNIKHFINYFILGRNKKKSENFQKFLSQHFKLSKGVSAVESVANDYDLIIVGSDQVWNPEYTNGRLDKNFLHVKSGGGKVKWLSYASSAGSWVFDREQLVELTGSLRMFDAVSVREDALQAQMKAELPEAKVVLDPTFLLDGSQWNASFDLADDTLKKENYVLIYTFDDNPLCFIAARKIADQLSCKVYAIASTYFKNAAVDRHFNKLSPTDFLRYFYNAKYIITNSFHGVCFSINFGKPFMAIRKENNPVRVEGLLRKLGLEDRLVANSDQVNFLLNAGVELIRRPEHLDELRKESQSFLIQNI